MRYNNSKGWLKQQDRPPHAIIDRDTHINKACCCYQILLLPWMTSKWSLHGQCKSGSCVGDQGTLQGDNGSCQSLQHEVVWSLNVVIRMDWVVTEAVIGCWDGLCQKVKLGVKAGISLFSHRWCIRIHAHECGAARIIFSLRSRLEWITDPAHIVGFFMSQRQEFAINDLGGDWVGWASCCFRVEILLVGTAGYPMLDRSV